VSALALDGAAPDAPALAFEALALHAEDGVALDGVSLAIARGEHAVLFGASGAGKSALLRTALGLTRADGGRATLLGADVAALGGAARRRVLARVGVLFAQDALFDDRAVEDNVALGVRDGRPHEAARRAVREALLLVGLKHVDHCRPATLTAGERRRVALARAIAGGPELLLADEPARGLDPVASGAVYALLAQLRTRLGLTLLVASSDPRALEGADRAAFLHRGRIVACDRPALLRTRTDAALHQLLAGRPWGPIAP